MPCLEQVLIWSCRQSLEMQQVAVNWKQSNQSCVQAAAILTPRTWYDCNNICACHVWCYIIYTNIDYHVLYTYKHIHATILYSENLIYAYKQLHVTVISPKVIYGCIYSYIHWYYHYYYHLQAYNHSYIIYI